MTRMVTTALLLVIATFAAVGGLSCAHYSQLSSGLDASEDVSLILTISLDELIVDGNPVLLNDLPTPRLSATPFLTMTPGRHSIEWSWETGFRSLFPFNKPMIFRGKGSFDSNPRDVFRVRFDFLTTHPVRMTQPSTMASVTLRCWATWIERREAGFWPRWEVVLGYRPEWADERLGGLEGNYVAPRLVPAKCSEPAPEPVVEGVQ